MIVISNDKDKSYLKITLKSSTLEKELYFSSEEMLAIPLIETIESTKYVIRDKNFGVNKLEQIKIINHVVGSIHDYYKYLKDDN